MTLHLFQCRHIQVIHKTDKTGLPYSAGPFYSVCQPDFPTHFRVCASLCWNGYRHIVFHVMNRLCMIDTVIFLSDSAENIVLSKQIPALWESVDIAVSTCGTHRHATETTYLFSIWKEKNSQPGTVPIFIDRKNSSFPTLEKQRANGAAGSQVAPNCHSLGMYLLFSVTCGFTVLKMRWFCLLI